MFGVLREGAPLKLAGVTWFDYNKETDWRVDSSGASLAAFKYELA
jgi:hypothetical protein